MQPESFSSQRANQLISLLLSSTNPQITRQQAEVAANTITSAFNVTPRATSGSKSNKKKNNKGTRKTGQHFAIVESNNTESRPVSIHVNSNSDGYGADAQINNGFVTLHCTRRQAKALRYALNTYFSQSQQSGSEGSWEHKVQQTIQNVEQMSSAAVA